MAQQYMPASGERGAPKFDKTKPRELTRFFSEFERCLARVGINSETEKKSELLRYVDFDTEQIWKRLPEFADITKTYVNFRDAIMVYYPDPTGDFLYSTRDLEILIADCQQKGINTTEELQAYHLAFVGITTWLIEKDHMGDFEQRSSYSRAFQRHLLGNINSRLQLTNLNHHPNKPYQISEIYEAARYLLQCSDTAIPASYPPIAVYPASSSTQVVASPAPVVAYSIPVVASPAEPTVKVETFASALADFSKSFTEAITLMNRTRITGPTEPSSYRRSDCNFCGAEHYIRDCPLVLEYITAGKCRRNHEGKVVLSTGAYVPRDIPGNLLRERVDEWHRRFPGQLSAAVISAATMIHTISHPQSRQNSDVATTPAFHLTTTDRITALEAELFNLRARRPAFTPQNRTRAQRIREVPLEATITEVNESPVAAARGPTPETTQPATEVSTVASIPAITITPVPQQPAEPEHPYHLAKDAAYAPPTSRNVGALPKIPQAAKAAAPAYKTLPPIHDVAIATNVYERAMDACVSITQRELLSLSPEVRAKYRDSTTTRRIPNVAGTQASLQMIADDEELPYDPALVLALDKSLDRQLPHGATIVADPIEEYYQSLKPGEEPNIDRLTVAKESTAIRSITALIDNTLKKECTVDPGCQVIAMSEKTCHSLALAYDPKIRLNMESANGSFDWSLGLARNVPFLIGTITLYLQVHVIRSPSYQILLGRPFDVLTESVVRNFQNEDQTITITDPNTGAQCTIPTFARGASCSHENSPSDF